MERYAHDLTKDEIHPVSGMSKIELYQWSTRDTPGELMVIPKTDLYIDHRYQRDANNSRALKLAKNWSWIACGVITVANRDGKFFVIDGQHRVIAAQKRADILNLPCIVFDTERISEESDGFFNANANRKMPAVVDLWRAKIQSGEKTYLYLNELLRMIGREPDKSASPTTVACLGTLVQLESKNHDALETIFPIVAEVCRGNVFHEKILSGLFYLECNLPEGQSIRDKKYRDRLYQVGYDALLVSANKAAAFYAKGGGKVYAIGIVQAMNKGRSTNRIDLG